VRHQQVAFLMQEHEQYPWFGKGMGGYVEGFVRDHQLPYSYEVQWAAFLMQFGYIGLFFLLVPLGIIYWNLLAAEFDCVRLGFALLFSLWIVSGFTNPFLISLTSGVVYTLFYLVRESYDRRRVLNLNHDLNLSLLN